MTLRKISLWIKKGYVLTVKNGLKGKDTPKS